MQIFCILHYVCTYIQGIPQIYKLFKTKSSNDYSLWQVFISLFAMICWTIYIFSEKTTFSLFLYIGTILDLSLMIFVDILIVIFFNFNTKKKKAKIF